MKLFVKHGIFLFATLLSLSTYSVMADEAVQSSTKSSVKIWQNLRQMMSLSAIRTMQFPI